MKHLAFFTQEDEFIGVLDVDMANVQKRAIAMFWEHFEQECSLGIDWDELVNETNFNTHAYVEAQLGDEIHEIVVQKAWMY